MGAEPRDGLGAVPPVEVAARRIRLECAGDPAHILTPARRCPCQRRCVESRCAATDLGAGVGYRLNDNVILQAGYRLQAAGAAEFEGRNNFGSAHSETDMRVHFLEIGLRYRF